MELSDYYKGAANYVQRADGSCVHNLERDLQLFIIWEGAFAFERDILAALSESFNIITSVRVQWSEDLFEENVSRLYKLENNKIVRQHCLNKVKNGFFVCVVVEDENPRYRYRQNISGTVELVNEVALNVKRDLRKRVGGNFIHGSSSPEEFFQQAALLFGVDDLLKIISMPEFSSISGIKGDLVGSSGWRSFAEFFSTLRYCSDYVVLRNFEFLPNDFFENDKDIDVLCANYNEFCLAANIFGICDAKGKIKNHVKVLGESIICDVRGARGRYIDPNWTTDLLGRKCCTSEGVFRPRDDDYFFTLLYHGALQKSSIKQLYIERLETLATHLELDFFDRKALDDPKAIANIIQGFLRAQGYVYSAPEDKTVYQNFSVITYIDAELVPGRSQRAARAYRQKMPPVLRRLVPVPLKRWVRRIL